MPPSKFETWRNPRRRNRLTASAERIPELQVTTTASPRLRSRSAARASRIADIRVARVRNGSVRELVILAHVDHDVLITACGELSRRDGTCALDGEPCPAPRPESSAEDAGDTVDPEPGKRGDRLGRVSRIVEDEEHGRARVSDPRRERAETREPHVEGAGDISAGECIGRSRIDNDRTATRGVEGRRVGARGPRRIARHRQAAAAVELGNVVERRQSRDVRIELARERTRRATG